MNIIAITACPTGVAHTYLAEANFLSGGSQFKKERREKRHNDPC